MITIEEINKEIEKSLEPQKENVRTLISELNGKVMDYESCRMLEDFFNDYPKIILEAAFRKLLPYLNKLKKEKK
jgi:hypothetical protein